MMKLIISRIVWTFVTLADLTALASLLELLNPKERHVAFVWNAAYDWLPILLCLAGASVIIGVFSLIWVRPARLPAE